MRRLLSSAGRVAILVTAVAVAAASSGSQNRASAPPPRAQQTGAPPPAEMDRDNALGLWHSSFGPVKIEPSGGGGVLMGVWVYDRQGEEVVGYFEGPIEGNVMEFSWEEPAQPQPLRGRGYLVFDPQGRNFHGKWWTESRDRGGEWNGWRSSPDLGRAGTGGQTYATPRGGAEVPAGESGAAPEGEGSESGDTAPPPGPPPPPPAGAR